MTTARKKDTFIKVPIWWATEAAKATKTPSPSSFWHLPASRLVEGKERLRFTLPNGWLERRGVSREIKRRVLRDLEAAGLIKIERTNRQSPRVTIVVL